MLTVAVLFEFSDAVKATVQSGRSVSAVGLLEECQRWPVLVTIGMQDQVGLLPRIHGTLVGMNASSRIVLKDEAARLRSRWQLPEADMRCSGSTMHGEAQLRFRRRHLWILIALRVRTPTALLQENIASVCFVLDDADVLFYRWKVAIQQKQRGLLIAGFLSSPQAKPSQMLQQLAFSGQPLLLGRGRRPHFALPPQEVFTPPLEFDLVAFGRRASLTGGLVMNPDLRSLRPLVGTSGPWRVETCRESGLHLTVSSTMHIERTSPCAAL